MAKSYFRIRDDEITPGLENLDERVKEVVENIMDYWAMKATTEMKSNAPWTDRTGAARAGLNATTQHDDKASHLILYHSVPYGIWLEIRWSGRYAIIGPTINAVGPRLAQMLAQTLID